MIMPNQEGTVSAAASRTVPGDTRPVAALGATFDIPDTRGGASPNPAGGSFDSAGLRNSQSRTVVTTTKNVGCGRAMGDYSATRCCRPQGPASVGMGHLPAANALTTRANIPGSVRCGA